MATIERSTTPTTPSQPRRRRRLCRLLTGLAWVVLLLICLNIAVVVSRYLSFDPESYFPEQREVYLRVEFYLGVHVLSGIVALLIGPLQFLGRVRRRFPRVHRFLGAAYVGGATALGLTGLVLAPTAYTGLVAVLGFTFLAVASLFTTWTAVRMVLTRRFADHRRWMIRSFSLVLAGVTLRLLSLGHAALSAAEFTDLTFETAYAAIAWLCWVPNLVVALWITRRSTGTGQVI